MSAPYYSDSSVTLHHGDCLDVLRTMPDASVDAIVTDPPYGLGFMGKGWDDLPPGLPWATECLRVLKPGGHLLAFGGSRTWHRLACAVEDAGFEIRDSIAWLYGSGFPKSLDVSKAIDRAAGAERAVVGLADRKTSLGSAGVLGASNFGEVPQITAPATPEAARWQGWGTALKPAFEPIVVARKPLAGTVAANVLAYGTGALNIDGCRVGTNGEVVSTPQSNPDNRDPSSYAVLTDRDRFQQMQRESIERTNTLGRWPPNVVLDSHAAAELDRQSGATASHGGGTRSPGGMFDLPGGPPIARGDQGGASRFFPTFRYEAKAPTFERPRVDGVAHPTCKPLDLMRWLVRLVTPPGGTVLDPFAGSGTTGEACVVEGFRCVLIEREADYLPLIVARLSKPIAPVLDFGASA